MKRFHFAFVLILVTASCSTEDDEVPVMVSADFAASQVVVEEGGNIDFMDLSVGDK